MPNRSIFWNSYFSKNMFLARFYKGVRRLRVAKVYQKSIKNLSKIDARTSDAKLSKNRKNRCRNGPKIDPQSVQSRCKNRCEICGPKIDQKLSHGALKGRHLCSSPSLRYWLWGSGVLGALTRGTINQEKQRVEGQWFEIWHAVGPLARRSLYPAVCPYALAALPPCRCGQGIYRWGEARGSV